MGDSISKLVVHLLFFRGAASAFFVQILLNHTTPYTHALESFQISNKSLYHGLVRDNCPQLGVLDPAQIRTLHLRSTSSKEVD